jgi:hypothetical protein
VWALGAAFWMLPRSNADCQSVRDGSLRGMVEQEHIKLALDEVKYAHLNPSAYEKPLREQFPNFFAELDQFTAIEVNKRLQGQPYENKPENEKYLLYTEMTKLFQAALIVASYGFAHWECSGGKTTDEQIDALRDWFLNGTTPPAVAAYEAAKKDGDKPFWREGDPTTPG